MMLVYHVTEYIICSLVIFMFYILYGWLINDEVYAKDMFETLHGASNTKSFESSASTVVF